MNKDLILVVGLCGESVFMKTDHFNQDGETIVIDNIHKEPGGKGYNQAITVKNLGVNAAFIGSIGDDESGKICIEYLDKMGVVNSLVIKNNSFSAYATITVDKHGNNNVAVYGGASNLLSIDDIVNNEHLFKRSKYLMLQLEVSDEILSKCFELAKKYDISVIFNPAPFKEYGRKYINDAYVITPNFHEAKKLFKLDDDINEQEIGKYLLSIGVNNIVVTLGKYGALVIENNELVYIEPLINDQTKVIDTTGAGDVFNGALAACLFKGLSLSESARYAMKASAYSIQKQYVMPSIPTVGDLNE